MDIIVGVIIGIIVLVVLVVLHELGHALVAKRNGVVVEEFGIGFPPRAYARKLKNGVLFTLNWLPLGGFVKLQGEHDSARKKGDYGAATFWQKTKILYAGVFVNWIVAAVLLTLLSLVGLPKIIPNQFSIPSDSVQTSSPVQLSALTKGYPAEKAGLKSGDVVTSFAGQSVETVTQLVDLTKANKGQTVPVVYTRAGEKKTTEVTLRDTDSATFGSSLSQNQAMRATWSAPIVGIATTGQFTWVTLQGLGQLVGDFFSGLVLQLSPNADTRKAATESLDRASNSVAGPVGILGKIFPAAGKAGPTEVVFLAAIISLTLAVMNTLPIPALDGGRWFVTALFRVLKKPLTKDREEMIQGIGFLILMTLVVVVTIGDVAKLF